MKTESSSPRSTRSHLANLSIFKVTKPHQWQWARKHCRNRAVESIALIFTMGGKWKVCRDMDKKVLDETGETYQDAVMKASALGYKKFRYAGKIREIATPAAA
jgi:hypothetical protein